MIRGETDLHTKVNNQVYLWKALRIAPGPLSPDFPTYAPELSTPPHAHREAPATVIHEPHARGAVRKGWLGTQGHKSLHEAEMPWEHRERTGKVGR